MQYAQILINSKSDSLDKVFTYTIPPKVLPCIKKGSFVSVPFGRRDKSGIVLNITRRIDSKIRYKLKAIKKLEYNFPVIDEKQLKLAKMISNYYLANLGQLVFFMTPKLSKRLVKNINIAFHSHLGGGNMVKSETRSKQFVIYNTQEKRIKEYTRLIDHAFKKNKSVILSFPDFAANILSISTLKKLFNDKIIIFSPDDTLEKNTQNWIKLKNDKSVLAIGTRNVLFNIPNHLGLIIIDEPNHFGYKEEQTIHHHTKEVSQFLTKITHANVVFGDNFPSINDLTHTDNKKIIANFDFIKKKKIIVVDNSINKSNFYNYQVENIAQRSIENNENILILTQGKGVASGLICQECEEIFRCPRCSKILIKNHENSKDIFCPLCKYKIKIPKICPNCKSKNIVEFGMPPKKLASNIKDNFPHQVTVLLANDKDFADFKTNKKNIYISDNYALSWKNLRFDNVVILDWENWHTFASHASFEKMIKNFISVCEISSKNIYIQTINPEDENIKKLLSFNFLRIYDQDLPMRKKFHYPPYYKLIKIYYRDKSHDNTVKQLEILKSKLGSLSINCEISDVIEEDKKRDKYTSSIILKTKNADNYSLKKILIEKYKYFNLSKYMIDVDPIKTV